MKDKLMGNLWARKGRREQLVGEARRGEGREAMDQKGSSQVFYES